MKEREIKEEKQSDLFAKFEETDVAELENLLVLSSDREQKIFYRTLINLKLQLEQEKIIGETLI